VGGEFEPGASRAVTGGNEHVVTWFESGRAHLLWYSTCELPVVSARGVVHSAARDIQSHVAASIGRFVPVRRW